MTTKLNRIRNIWAKNSFVNLLKVRIDDVDELTSRISLTIDKDVHTNHWLGVHGGVLATLADINAGLIGASIGKLVQTISLNINYIKKPSKKGDVIAIGETIHAGRTTMVVRSRIYDRDKKLLCDATLTMFIAGDLAGVLD